MSQQILVVPVEPVPPRILIEILSRHLSSALAREVRVVDPVAPPSAARVRDDRIASGPARAALATHWGCGCRGRLVGVTGAEVVEGPNSEAPGCGEVLIISLAAGGIGNAVRAVGRSYGLADCPDPDCAMHAGSDAPALCARCCARR